MLTKLKIRVFMLLYDFFLKILSLHILISLQVTILQVVCSSNELIPVFWGFSISLLDYILFHLCSVCFFPLSFWRPIQLNDHAFIVFHFEFLGSFNFIQIFLNIYQSIERGFTYIYLSTPICVPSNPVSLKLGRNFSRRGIEWLVSLSKVLWSTFFNFATSKNKK